MSARRRLRPAFVLLPLLGVTVLLLTTLPGTPSAQGMHSHPFPPAAGAPNRMAAPGLQSGPRLPLRPQPRTGYERFLAAPVEGASLPLFLGLLSFYRTVVSPVNGSNSDLAPVHSLYAVQAIKAHGVLLGLVLTTERLLHEADEIPFAPPLVEDGRTFHHDPLLWNVYWLPDWLR